MASKLLLPAVAASAWALVSSCAIPSETPEETTTVEPPQEVVEPTPDPLSTPTTTSVPSPFHMPPEIYNLPEDRDFQRRTAPTEPRESNVIARPPVEPGN